MFYDDESLFESLLKLATEYAYYDSQQRRLFLSGVVSYGILRQRDLNRGEKKSPMYHLNGVRSAERESVYLCKNAVRNLFCIGLMVWKNLVDDVVIPSKRVIPHLVNNEFKTTKCANNIIQFLRKLGEDEGESYATRFVRFLTGWGIRDQEREYIQLPSSFTK